MYHGKILFFEIFLRFLELLGQIFPESAWGCKIRGSLYKPFLKKCGKNFQIGLQVKLEHCNNIEIGNDVYIGHGSWISGIRGGINLDDEVMIGPMVCMVSSNHKFERGSARFAQGIGGHIFIGKGSWIASHATITSGVNLGPSCLVAAGAVVITDFPAGSKIGGIPAKLIGKLNA